MTCFKALRRNVDRDKKNEDKETLAEFERRFLGGYSGKWCLYKC